jgi:death-on-curing protein
MSGNEFQYLDLGLMELMCHRLAVDLFDLTEDPITPFTQHDQALLESALDLPRAAFQGKDMYPTLAAKAAVLWYTLNKNHPFGNGNKRISAASLLVFLYMNNHWLDVGKTELVNRSLQIAKSAASEREELLAELESWIAAHTITSEEAQKAEEKAV